MRGPAGVVDGLVGGRYRVTELIAVGGMGEVWRAEDTVLSRPVAVKLLKSEYVGDAEFAARFRAEARHAAGLSHPGIALVYDYGENDDAAWLVMELVDGEALSGALRREGALPVERTLDVVAQAAAALEAAHASGLVHRDVKPGNLLVRPDGVVKVTDFGIARAADAAPLTRTGTLVGTAFYLSPEQAAGTEAGPASDVYSLAVVAYECLTGSRPFPGDNPVAVAMAHVRETPPPLPESVPAPVRELVAAALDKDPARRPSTGELARVARELRDGLGAGATGAVPVLPVAPPPAVRPEGATSSTRVLPASPAPSGVLPRVPAAAGGARSVSRGTALRIGAGLLALLLLALLVRGCGGTAQATVPPVAAGTEQAAAERAVRDAGLEPQVRQEPSAEVTSGSVIRTDPAAGTRLDEGSDVALVVSSGPPKVTVDAQQYVGQPAARVHAELSALGLRPRLVDNGSGQPVGTVSGVTPAGALVLGSRVDVSVVPPPAPQPERRNGEGKGDDEDKDEQEDKSDDKGRSDDGKGKGKG